MNKNIVIGVASAIAIGAVAAVGVGVSQKSDKDTFFRRTSIEIKVEKDSGQFVLNHFVDNRPQIAEKLTCSIDISGTGVCAWHGWTKIEGDINQNDFDVIKLPKNVEQTPENIRNASKSDRRFRSIEERRSRGARP